MCKGAQVLVWGAIKYLVRIIRRGVLNIFWTLKEKKRGKRWRQSEIEL